MKNVLGVLVLMAAAPAIAAEPNADIVVLYLWSLNTVVAACAGALSAFAFAAPLKTRGKVFMTAFACTILGCASSSVLEGVAGHFRYTFEPQAVSSAALILSFLSRWFWPALIERIGPMLDRIPFLGKKEK